MSKSLENLIDINRLREFKSKLNAQNVFESLPAGIIIPFAGTSVPTGCLLCNGAAVSRTDYANLFTAIGTLYGAGDGSTTFNLPDARDRVLQGASGKHSVGSYIAAGLPDITGSLRAGGGHGLEFTGQGAFHDAIYLSPQRFSVDNDLNSGDYGSVSFNASRSNSIYSSSSSVQQPAVTVQYLIKY